MNRSTRAGPARTRVFHRPPARTGAAASTWACTIRWIPMMGTRRARRLAIGYMHTTCARHRRSDPARASRPPARAAGSFYRNRFQAPGVPIYLARTGRARYHWWSGLIRAPKGAHMRFTLTLALCLVMVSAARAQITPSPYWSSTVQYATTPFAVIPLDPNAPHWAKFSIFLSPPSDVYFQDSNHYPFHYDFATERLDPYLGIDRSTFNSITLLNSGQQLQLGAVLFPPQSNLNTGPREFAIQFIRTDPIAPQAIVDFFNTVKSKVTFDGTPPTALYFPTFEQQDTANANAAFFAANGITVSSAARWTEGNRCYSAGWALGTVRFVTASQVQAAYNAGTLRPDDILLTDGVPAELPLVAGIISLAPVTANSHTVLLAQTYASPMVYLALAGDVANAQSLIGRKALLSSYIVSDLANITLVDVQDSMTPEFEAQLQTLHAPGTIQYTPMEANGSYSLNTEGLH